MIAIDLAEMIRKLLDAEINKSRREIVRYLQSCRSRKITGPDNGVPVGPGKNTQDIVIENESKDTKIRI